LSLKNVIFKALVIRVWDTLPIEEVLNIAHAEGKKMFKTHDPVFVYDVERKSPYGFIVVIGDQKPIVSRELAGVSEGKSANA